MEVAQSHPEISKRLSGEEIGQISRFDFLRSVEGIFRTYRSMNDG
jgi:hypothetical protein